MRVDRKKRNQSDQIQRKIGERIRETERSNKSKTKARKKERVRLKTSNTLAFNQIVVELK